MIRIEVDTGIAAPNRVVQSLIRHMNPLIRNVDRLIANSELKGRCRRWASHGADTLDVDIPVAEILMDTGYLNIQPPIVSPTQVQPLGVPGQMPTVPIQKVVITPPGG